MSISSTLDRLHLQAKENRWLWYFSIFNRLALAAGFIPSGMVKILGERFASGVSANHPMGHYLEALHTTGYYYTFIGIVQVAAALMLLIPRTVTLGAFLYFPIILNICILTFAVRFDGSLFTAPLMVLANLYLLGWNYDKWKYILPFNHPEIPGAIPKQKSLSNKFPVKFFAGVFVAVIVFMLVVPKLYDVLPRNSLSKCQRQFKDSNRTKAGDDFCNCVHTNGEPLDKCLDEYKKAPEDIIRTP
jgi:uncharacterized membrane protein YphA (DoxX/SURF4 family)